MFITLKLRLGGPSPRSCSAQMNNGCLPQPRAGKLIVRVNLAMNSKQNLFPKDQNWETGKHTPPKEAIPGTKEAIAPHGW